MSKNLALVLVLSVAVSSAPAAVESLTVGDVTYRNVTLKKEFPVSFFVQHDGGMAFVKRADLSEEQIAGLLGAPPPAASEPAEDSAPEPEEPSAADPAPAENEEASSAEPAETPATENAAPAEEEKKEEKVTYVHPKPESLESEEEKKFFEACGKADTSTIVAMLKENPSLAKVTMKGQSSRLIRPEPVGDERPRVREEPADATCDALQWLIDESPKTPERIEAIKALVEAGADPTRTTSEAGCNMARGVVTLPDKLTPEELDYLLGKGADPNFGFCVGSIHPMVKLAVGFVTEEDEAKKAAHGELLRVFIKKGADPAAAGGSWGTRQYGGKLAEAGSVNSAAQIGEITQDPDLVAILAGK